MEQWVGQINLEFKRCVNTQTDCVIRGQVDPGHSLLTATAFLITLPVLKAAFTGDYGPMALEYLAVFALVGWWLWSRFSHSSAMEAEYHAAEERLSGEFQRIQEEFNGEFGWLEMSHLYCEEEEKDFLEIRVICQPP